MKKENIVNVKKPETVSDLLTEVLRNGAKNLLAAAVNAEVEEFLLKNNRDKNKARFIRNGYLPEREIQTGIGNVAVTVPRVRDRSGGNDGLRFGSSVILMTITHLRELMCCSNTWSAKIQPTTRFKTAEKPRP